MKNKIQTILALIGAGVLIVILVFIFQLPSISPRHLLIGDRTLGGGDYLILELVVGAIASLIITFLVAAVWERLALYIAGLSVGIQVLWIYFTQQYIASANSLVELLSRLAEPGGVVLGAIAAIFLAHSIKSRLRKPSKPD
jgi:hypothetical protein